MRPAGEAEDTARLDDDARFARRLAIDRQTQGCVADETKREGVGAGVSRACPVDSPARLQIIVDRASRVGLTRIFINCAERLVPCSEVADDHPMTLTRHFALMAIIVMTASAAAGAQTRVVDGDTFDLDGLRIRISGVDAPEFGQRCGDWDCGQAALEYLDELVSAGTVSCEALDQDKYGRTIARCDVDGQDLGNAMIAAGLAHAFTRYSDEYVSAEETARMAVVGIWQGDYETPWDYRARKWAEAALEAPEGCPIKGNISSGGRIYHPPWSPWYGKTRINTSKGERWFCSEDEAIAAGWRAPVWR